jgi:hypothetical protein
VDASVHRRLDQGSNVLVLNSTLAANFVESATVGAVSHGLILEITFTSLVANRAVKRVVGEQEFHDTLTGLVGDGRVGLDDHARLHWPCTRGDGLGGLFDLDQAHSAVSGNHEFPASNY